MLKKILAALVVVIIAAGALLFITVRKMYTPTTGPKIASYVKPAKALLVIDVHEDYTGVSGGKEPQYRNVGPQIDRINRLIEKATGSGIRSCTSGRSSTITSSRGI